MIETMIPWLALVGDPMPVIDKEYMFGKQYECPAGKLGAKFYGAVDLETIVVWREGDYRPFAIFDYKTNGIYIDKDNDAFVDRTMSLFSYAGTVCSIFYEEG